MRAYFGRHAQTLVGSLGRIVGQPFATLMTIGVVAVALALPLFLNLFLINVRTATEYWNDAFDLSVYMDKQASSNRVAAVAAVLAKPVDALARLYGSQFHLQGVQWKTAILVLGLAVGLAWSGSWLAATRHIRALDPT